MCCQCLYLQTTGRLKRVFFCTQCKTSSVSSTARNEEHIKLRINRFLWSYEAPKSFEIIRNRPILSWHRHKTDKVDRHTAGRVTNRCAVADAFGVSQVSSQNGPNLLGSMSSMIFRCCSNTASAFQVCSVSPCYPFGRHEYRYIHTYTYICIYTYIIIYIYILYNVYIYI